jgi:pimeloyl-ACP methyl ester carboxylesterase
MKLPYVVDGDGAGHALVFAHGLMGTGTAQRMQLAPLVAAGWTVATFDQRGHGAAPGVTDPALYDPEAMGADLWEVADAAGFDRCWIGGGSMGAATSFCAARRHPERVEGFIQAVPALRDAPHPLVFLFDALADEVRDRGTDGLVAVLRKLTADMGREEEDVIFLEQLRTHDPASIECALRSVPRWILPDVPSAFADFDFPVYVVGWDDDPIHPLQTAKDVAAAAGVDLIEADQSVVMGDRELFGKLLLEHLPA